MRTKVSFLSDWKRNDQFQTSQKKEMVQLTAAGWGWRISDGHLGEDGAEVGCLRPLGHHLLQCRSGCVLRWSFKGKGKAC